MPFVAIAIGIVAVLVDQIIKFFVSSNLKPIGSVSVIDNIFSLTYVENRGVAFGMFSDMRWVFVALTSVLLFLLIFYMFKRKPNSKLFYISTGLIIGGGIGNLIDRIFYGYVIDYLSLSFFSPVCNFADYCITVGTVLLIIYLLFISDDFKGNKKAKNND